MYPFLIPLIGFCIDGGRLRHQPQRQDSLPLSHGRLQIGIAVEHKSMPLIKANPPPCQRILRQLHLKHHRAFFLRQKGIQKHAAVAAVAVFLFYRKMLNI